MNPSLPRGTGERMTMIGSTWRMACALTLVVSSELSAQSGVVALQVIDAMTDAPLADVGVAVAGDSVLGATDARGRYVFVAPTGRLPVLLRRLGYLPETAMIDVVVGDTTRVTFAMSRFAQPLGTVAVRDTLSSTSAMLRGFEYRRKLGIGSARFFTRADIERQRPMRTLDLLRLVPSLNVSDNGAASRRGTKIGMGLCPLQVALDGVLTERGFDPNTIPPAEIHGIEVYPGPATIPLQYASTRRDAGCGLIMIWTRRDR